MVELGHFAVSSALDSSSLHCRPVTPLSLSLSLSSKLTASSRLCDTCSALRVTFLSRFGLLDMLTVTALYRVRRLVYFRPTLDKTRLEI
jgi:hypothetical protein